MLSSRLRHQHRPSRRRSKRSVAALFRPPGTLVCVCVCAVYCVCIYRCAWLLLLLLLLCLSVIGIKSVYVFSLLFRELRLLLSAPRFGNPRWLSVLCSSGVWISAAGMASDAIGSVFAWHRRYRRYTQVRTQTQTHTHAQTHTHIDMPTYTHRDVRGHLIFNHSTPKR